MKNLNFIVLTIIITMFNHQKTITKAQNNLGSKPLAENIDYTVYTAKTKLKRNGPLEFAPDNDFGGTIAQGIYDYKHKTATIIYTDFDNNIIKYSFNNIKEKPSPEQPYEDFVMLGSFINGITKGMPVTMYLFGQLTNKKYNTTK